MAKKAGLFSTIATLGVIASAAAAVYYKRNEIREVLDEVIDRFLPDTDEPDTEFETAADEETEKDIVIDQTAGEEEC